MKTRYSSCFLLFAVFTINVVAEGYAYFGSQGAPTRIGTADGPLAGTNIVSQLLVGYNASMLLPVGTPQVNIRGIFTVTPIAVPQSNPGDLVFLQLVC